MLEFQEGFFEQEIRDGFYIDTTMKTVWAAELEVLQKVAEICDRHGLVWYAAYGTLLGAIRHEGFVPWDDDMDIWVKRADYNKLTKILPKELPEGYFVRSPLTEEGYDQFHMLVNSGNRISIDPKWLEQYHGCPFSVGLDIFPLDYLARDEEERIMQENLVRIACRGAQVACTLFRETFDDVEEPEKARKELVEEIEDAIRYLEANCGIKIDYKLVEEEKWYALSSEFGKWGNYFAMMYGEEESDYLVNFIDYVRFPGAKYPKEWFDDVYGAAFENFMLPVSCGYDKLLPRIYGAYMVCRKKNGTHDYPYYARQLEELKERVENEEKQAEILGLISLDAALQSESEDFLPSEWEKIMEGEGEERKKIILYENDVAVFLMSPKEALDRMEETLKKFETVKSSIVLWWRPQRNMAYHLKTISEKYAERYERMLSEYKRAAWGICDETGNTCRAVEFCDAYYGDMNSILQPFQNADKPAVIMQNGRERETDNLDRINEFRAFLSFADFAEDEERIYFANTNYNALIIVRKENWQVEKRVLFAETERGEQNMHLRCVKKRGKICFLPAKSQCIHIYDTEKEQQYTYFFENTGNDENEMEGAWDYHESRGQVYLLPDSSVRGLWRWNIQKNTIEQENWWEVQQEECFWQHGSIDKEIFYSLSGNPGRLFVTDVEKHTIETFDLPDDNVSHITYDGENFWYTMEGSLDIVCWNWKTGVVDRYLIQSEIYWDQNIMAYMGICYAAENLFLFSSKCDTFSAIYILNKKERKLKSLYNIDSDKCAFWEHEMQPNFKRIDNKLICPLKNAGEIMQIDLASLEVRRYREAFLSDTKLQENMLHILLDRKALLYEGQEGVSLETLFHYCMAHEGSEM